MKRCILMFLILSITFSTTTIFAAAKYERKSISYINRVWLATPEAKQVQPEQVNYMLEQIKREIEMDRFDYNPLPEKLITDLTKAANDKKNLTVDQIAGLMKENLVPWILKILDVTMMERAGELLDDTKKQKFMATKAKELGITIEEIEKVMNSAYIYLPVLTSYKKDKKEDKKFVYTITGGIVWFHINLEGNHPTVNLQVSKTTKSSGFGKDKFAYQSAMRNFARNLKVATQEIPEFKLQGTVKETDGGTFSFNLGKKEGVGMDETYFVGEWVMNAKNETEFERRGWARVGKVGDNREAKVNYSSAWIVKNGGIAEHMSVIEHPRLPIDIAFKPAMHFMTIGEGAIPTFDQDLIVEEDYTDPAFGLDIDAQYNMAKLFGVSQLYLLVGGSFAISSGFEFVTADQSIFTDMTTASFIWGLHGGLLKKFYFGQSAIGVGANFGIKSLMVQQKFNYTHLFSTEQYTYYVDNSSAGVQANLTYEFAASPNVNIGILAGMKFFGISNTWNAMLEHPNGEEETGEFDDTSAFPEIDHSGLVIGLYLHYTPPGLRFDPADWVRGAMQ